VHVGQTTVGEDGDDVRHGVTVILPRHPDDINTPCYAGTHTLNGNGEVSGSFQIKDWGFINTVRPSSSSSAVFSSRSTVLFTRDSLSPSPTPSASGLFSKRCGSGF
jgi:D-aminopeptidase